MTTTQIVVTIAAILLMGIINICLNQLKLMKQMRKLDEYHGVVSRILEKLKASESIDEEKYWVLKNTDLIVAIVKPDLCDSIFELKNYIVYNNKIGIETYCCRLSWEVISHISQIDNKRTEIKNQLFNPCIWFYRGIELITMIVAGYPVKQFNPTFDYDSKPWKAINLIFTIISGLSSIIGLFLTLKNE